MDTDRGESRATSDRRAFLAAAGKFAVITPPAMTMLLSTTLTSPAIAQSGRGGGIYNEGGDGDGDEGWSHHHHHHHHHHH